MVFGREQNSRPAESLATAVKACTPGARPSSVISSRPPAMSASLRLPTRSSILSALRSAAIRSRTRIAVPAGCAVNGLPSPWPGGSVLSPEVVAADRAVLRAHEDVAVDVGELHEHVVVWQR